MTEKSKVHNPQSYTNPKLKDKDFVTSFQEISSRVSTEVYTTIQSEDKQEQDFWCSMETAQILQYCKENNENYIQK